MKFIQLARFTILILLATQFAFASQIPHSDSTVIHVVQQALLDMDVPNALQIPVVESTDPSQSPWAVARNTIEPVITVGPRVSTPALTYLAYWHAAHYKNNTDARIRAAGNWVIAAANLGAVPIAAISYNELTQLCNGRCFRDPQAAANIAGLVTIGGAGYVWLANKAYQLVTNCVREHAEKQAGQLLIETLLRKHKEEVLATLLVLGKQELHNNVPVYARYTVLRDELVRRGIRINSSTQEVVCLNSGLKKIIVSCSIDRQEGL